MIKYTNCEVVFEELPKYVTLAINISNCQHHCFGCHSPFLRNNIGNELTNKELDNLIKHNDGINCVCFMGEGNDKDALLKIAKYVKEKYNNLKIAIYSGGEDVDKEYNNVFDFIKIGPYIEKYGPLNKETTNQRLYEVVNGERIDITSEFWNRK